MMSPCKVARGQPGPVLSSAVQRWVGGSTLRKRGLAPVQEVRTENPQPPPGIWGLLLLLPLPAPTPAEFKARQDSEVGPYAKNTENPTIRNQQLIKSCGEDRQRPLTGDLQMASKPATRCSASDAVRELQMKNQLKIDATRSGATCSRPRAAGASRAGAQTEGSAGSQRVPEHCLGARLQVGPQAGLSPRRVI